ncbi:hypothetical protein [Thermovirga lienii]|jgi:hypothetical protein|uniref:hypothetical protein n=1 Tax=Thermovirga lienii TaxID=336261 RepID=UPI002FE0222A
MVFDIKNSYVLGIDPGIYGAGCIVSLDGKQTKCFLLPMRVNTEKTKVLDTLKLYNTLERHKDKIYFCIVEKPIYMPHQSVKSTFKVGEIFGGIVGVLDLLEVPVTYVPPKEWQKGVLYDRTEADIKEKSIAKALEIVSELPVTHRHKRSGLADAVCIAEYGRQLYLSNFVHPHQQKGEKEFEYVFAEGKGGL